MCAYTALPDRRIPYDNDGTIVGYGNNGLTEGLRLLPVGSTRIEHARTRASRPGLRGRQGTTSWAGGSSRSSASSPRTSSACGRARPARTLGTPAHVVRLEQLGQRPRRDVGDGQPPERHDGADERLLLARRDQADLVHGPEENRPLPHRGPLVVRAAGGRRDGSPTCTARRPPARRRTTSSTSTTTTRQASSTPRPRTSATSRSARPSSGSSGSRTLSATKTANTINIQCNDCRLRHLD